MELVDVTDSKSVGGNIVWVRVPPPAPAESLDAQSACGAFFFAYASVLAPKCHFFVSGRHQAGPGADTRSGAFLLPDAPPAF